MVWACLKDGLTAEEVDALEAQLAAVEDPLPGVRQDGPAGPPPEWAVSDAEAYSSYKAWSGMMASARG